MCLECVWNVNGRDGNVGVNFRGICLGAYEMMSLKGTCFFVVICKKLCYCNSGV